MEQVEPVESIFSPGTELGTLDDSEITCLTPRRRLSLDKQEKSPPTNETESGFCSSLDTSSPIALNEGSQSSLDSVFLGTSSSNSSSGSSGRHSSTVNGGGSYRRYKQARRASRLRCCSTSSENKENQGIHKKDGVFKIPSFLPFQDRPVSLPSFPSSPMEDSNYKQINSPLGNLVLSSPPSDGFDAEVLSETTEDSENNPPQSLGALLVSPTTQFVNAVDNPASVLKPTPVRPRPCLHGKQLQRQLSVSSADNHQDTTRPTKRYILSPHHESVAKKSPSLYCDSQPSRSTTNVSPKQSFLRSFSCVVHPTQSQTSDEDELIGDQTKPYCLPIEKSASPFDLKCISPQTVADVVSGEYDEVITSYTIIDCRYPYEYNGGQIKGAINIWNKDDLIGKFLSNPSHPKETDRNILIFHCEFSSKRGPDMSRFLRRMDRQKNDMDFPKLYHPEMYLAHGGYKSFYEQFPSLCVPEDYCSMMDDLYKDEYRIFSKRSKSWSGESKKRCPAMGRRRNTLLGDEIKCTASRQL